MTPESLPLISCSGIQLCQSRTRAERPWIRGRSVTPNRVKKWQMLWNSFSSVTTETVSTWKQRPNMENRFSLRRRSRTGTFCCLHMHTTTNTNRRNKGWLWMVYLSHTWADWASSRDKNLVFGLSQRPSAISWVLGQSSLCWRMLGSCWWLLSKLFVCINSILIFISFESLFFEPLCWGTVGVICIFWIGRSKGHISGLGHQS